MSLSDLLYEHKLKKEAEQVSRILNTRSYRDAFGNKLNASQKQMEFLLRNFDVDVIQRMLKQKEAWIMFDDYYIEVFFAHSLTTDDMCIVFNNTQCEGEDEDEQAAITIDRDAKLINTYIGDIKYDYNSEDQTILI